jgi:hypothetical protein
LLVQENAQANGSLIGSLPKQDVIVEEESRGSPKATVARRAQSYSDFHYAVMAALDPKSKAEAKEQIDSVHEHKKASQDDLSFDDWYGGVEDELFEASHDEYK